MAGKPFIYLDHAAATPVDPAVLRAMQPYFATDFYNPSATYTPALEVRKGLEVARAKVAHWLGSRPSEVVFTAGGTEANNLAIHGVMRRFPEGNVVFSSIEHESVLEPAGNYECRQVAVQPDGRLDLDNLAKKIDKNTVLVSIMYANNEIGTIQPIRQIAKVVAEKRAGRKNLPLYFHTDACQAANYLDLHVARLGVDLLTINGGKIYGSKQSGALYVKAGTTLLPLIQGGGQERGLRSGTENVAAAVGLATALESVQAGRHQETKRLQALQQEFFKLVEAKIPQAVINGSRKWRLPNNVHLTLPGQDNERLLIQLETAGILSAAGSACSAANEEPSHVLKAMGISDADARASLRLTMGHQTTKAAVEKTVKTLAGLLLLTD
ncbi:aminotransferase [Candidatus Saccharibacteria bacterium CG_4_10_14_0_2_um_filter_52_9]|nr:MAG: aminotransferase [Candidatus Saccharibacteria bacterium CG_4_10_14_0_2_um_filter_52_9]